MSALVRRRELRNQDRSGGVGSIGKSARTSCWPTTNNRAGESIAIDGAGDGTRTHDILLGKQTLYQLSYTRIGPEYSAQTC